MQVRVLVIGAGGVGTAFVRTAAKWNLFERIVVTDFDQSRAEKAVVGTADRFVAYRLDGSDESAIVDLIAAEKITVVLNALDPRFVMPIFRAAFRAGVHYLDMAMSMSHPDPIDPYHKTGVRLGDEQFAMEEQWLERGQLALCGIGVT